jgi:hypothetical protein
MVYKLQAPWWSCNRSPYSDDYLDGTPTVTCMCAAHYACESTSLERGFAAPRGAGGRSIVAYNDNRLGKAEMNVGNITAKGGSCLGV